VRRELAPRLAVTARAEEGKVFAWEAAHRTDAGRVPRKVVQCVVDLLAFCVVPLSALVVYWAGGDVSAGLVVVSVAEAASVVGLGALIVRYALPFGAAGAASG
jgi:hypothetical protein